MGTRKADSERADVSPLTAAVTSGTIRKTAKTLSTCPIV